MKHYTLLLLIGLAAAMLGLGLGCVLFSRREDFKKLGSADLLIMVLLTVSAIATGGMLGYVLLVRYTGPFNMVILTVAAGAFGEVYYRIFLKLVDK